MAGMQFEYDEKGGTFYYFLLSFVGLIVVPSTYYLWPRQEASEDLDDKKQCHCDPCRRKRNVLKTGDNWGRWKKRFTKIALIIGWIILALLAYKVSTIETDMVEYDPFTELEIDRGASTSEIRKAYRKLSLTYHPDKETGDAKKFMRIAKAYAALTDEESRKNWETFGNPDGPGATHFGIALPKWIVEKQNSVWVLAAYCVIFMIILPVVVGTWWYRSIKFSADQILLDTTQLYFYYFHKTPNMILKRVIMVLSASFEFDKGHNNEIIERPTDNEEVPMLMRDLPNVGEKNKEKPFCIPYSVKARTLIYAHINRMELPPKTLEQDSQMVLKKCPYLLNEMVNIVAQLVGLGHAGRVSRMPRLETIENVMRTSQLVIQSLREAKMPFMQLPHISEDMMRHFSTKRRNIRTLSDLVQMKDSERRLLLRTLDDHKYQDVMTVLSTMPLVQMEISTGVLDDEDTTVTAGSIVTVTVNLHRQNMEVLFENNDIAVQEEEEDEESRGLEDVDDEKGEGDAVENTTDATAKPKVWEKQKKKQKGKAAKKNKKIVKTVHQRKPVGSTPTAATANAPASKDDSKEGTPNGRVEEVKKARAAAKKEKLSDDESVSGTDSEDEDSESDMKEVKAGKAEPDDDEDDWARFQEEAKKENVLEAKSKDTHPVHCPYFPADKQEWWWLYVADRKNHLLITAPVQVTSLKDYEEIQLKFSAPPKPGVYQYTVCLISDSYVTFDQYQNIKMDVKEAKKIESHPQWDLSESEGEKGDEELSEESDFSSDFEDSDKE